MTRTLLAVCLVVASVAMPARAQEKPAPQQARSVAGQWRVDFVTPLGQNWIIMTLNQSGTKITGHATDEFGEYQLSRPHRRRRSDRRLVGRRRRQDARDHDEGKARNRRR